MKTVIIDYGMGNLRSVQKAVESLGYAAEISSDPQIVTEADKLILPGVGAFPQAMENLQKKDLLPAIKAALDRPFLGICLGMQLLLSSSEEFGLTDGLNALPGRVEYFRKSVNFPADLPVPHIGWNDVRQKKDTLFKGLPETFTAYFVHSYYAVPDAASVVSGVTDYGIDFCSALEKDNIFGVQFHPEKSGENGLQILKNFLEI
ncbi:imidazole glycerol phosphate synthase subunit H [Candidatus Termititenax dinenymphae]|uniref:Imidazole glycerol phosphate synthase subunit HisH n=1 Tax=Candidatus Termititenax dinenymphae TaxID=2218523 RepID=A0A388TJR1_9BACT|nr:imidazole glycerol phosphate synthase subunit H [Candidatus Termititenax dinenymphae]